MLEKCFQHLERVEHFYFVSLHLHVLQHDCFLRFIGHVARFLPHLTTLFQLNDVEWENICFSNIQTGRRLCSLPLGVAINN